MRACDLEHFQLLFLTKIHSRVDMVGMSIFSLSATVCCLAVLVIVCVRHELALFHFQWSPFHYVAQFFTTGKAEDKLLHEIVIGVLSARQNAAQRQAIRETWARHIQNTPGLKNRLLARFIIGDKGCDIPSGFREDPYSCSSILANASSLAASLKKETVAFDFKIPSTKMLTRKIHSNSKQRYMYYGIDFKVNHALVVRRLGIYNTGFLHHQPTVTVYDTWRQESVISVTFSPDDPGTLHDGYRYKDVEAYLLPKTFEGTVVAGPFCQEDLPLQRIQTNPSQNLQESDKILSVRTLHRTAQTASFPDQIEFPNLPIPAANFILEIYKPEEVERMLNSRMTVEQLQAETNNRESQALETEQEQHGDLLLVDAVDVYRNIPRKLLKFLQWVTNSTQADLVIKTDDDCFLNVDAIMETLQDGHITANSHSWWGSFRSNWPLDVLGKWAEYEYPSPVYPAFACGSGNLLSRDLVQWIAENSQHLHSYQGEDVSMGIWLASILPTYINDKRWQCDNTCHQDVFVLPEQSPQDLKFAWQNWLRCQNPCRCD